MNVYVFFLIVVLFYFSLHYYHHYEIIGGVIGFNCSMVQGLWLCPPNISNGGKVSTAGLPFKYPHSFLAQGIMYMIIMNKTH